MYKTVLAFVIGAAVAAGIAVYVVKRNQPVAQPAPVAVSTPAPEPTPAPLPPEAQPPSAPAPSSKPAPAGTPARWKPAKKEAASAPVAQNNPPAATSPAPQPAQTPAQPSGQAAQAPPPVTATRAPESAPLPPPPPPKPQPRTVTIPAGTLLSVRLAQTLNSDQLKPGDAFSATLDQPLIVDGFIIAERGARVQGRVVDAQQAGRVKGVSHLALQLVSLHTSDGQNISLKTQTFEKEGEKSVGKDAAKVGAAAAIGAAIGAIAGGGRGAAIGAGVGGAAGTGGVLATRGKPVELKVETRLTFKLTDPITVTEKLN